MNMNKVQLLWANLSIDLICNFAPFMSLSASPLTLARAPPPPNAVRDNYKDLIFQQSNKEEILQVRLWKTGFLLEREPVCFQVCWRVICQGRRTFFPVQLVGYLSKESLLVPSAESGNSFIPTPLGFLKGMVNYN